MSHNGGAASQVLDATGHRALASATMEPPTGSSPFFGWLGPDGFSSVRIDAIQAICPDQRRTGQYVLSLKYGAAMVINTEDAMRLMKRLGWSQKSALHQG